MATSLIVLPSISSKTLVFPKTLNASPSFFTPSLSFKTLSKPISISSVPLFPLRASRLLTKVAVYDQEHGISGGGGRTDSNFPPELKLFVGNLPFNVDSGDLAGLFGEAGNVEVVEVIYDKLTGRSRGFGFVTMSTTEEVKAAEQQFNGYELEGRPLRVNSGPPPPKDDSFRTPRTGGFDSPRGGGGGGVYDNPNRVYVGNLSWSVDNQSLESLFSEQGKVMEAKVVFDRETGRSRGFGFVTYSSADEVTSAINLLNGVDLGGREIQVTAAQARPPRRQY